MESYHKSGILKYALLPFYHKTDIDSQEAYAIMRENKYKSGREICLKKNLVKSYY